MHGRFIIVKSGPLISDRTDQIISTPPGEFFFAFQMMWFPYPLGVIIKHILYIYVVTLVCVHSFVIYVPFPALPCFRWHYTSYIYTKHDIKQENGRQISGINCLLNLTIMTRVDCNLTLNKLQGLLFSFSYFTQRRAATAWNCQPLLLAVITSNSKELNEFLDGGRKNIRI
jgi:hypothetical protein